MVVTVYWTTSELVASSRHVSLPEIWENFAFHFSEQTCWPQLLPLRDFLPKLFMAAQHLLNPSYARVNTNKTIRWVYHKNGSEWFEGSSSDHQAVISFYLVQVTAPKTHIKVEKPYSEM